MTDPVVLPVAHTRATTEVVRELNRALARNKVFNSPHEGWAVIKEEMDELWEHVRGNTGRGPDARGEAMQVAAMAIRYMADLT